MPPDVAGATFMAAGSSAPELATAVIGVFVAQVTVKVPWLTCHNVLLKFICHMLFMPLVAKKKLQCSQPKFTYQRNYYENAKMLSCYMLCTHCNVVRFQSTYVGK